MNHFSQPEPAAIVEPPLKGFQVMLIVCAIFFLSLVLLGLAASYYCLSRRRVAVIRRRPMTLSLAGSDITKMSESSISMFEGLKIPRATVTPISKFLKDYLFILSLIQIHFILLR